MRTFLQVLALVIAIPLAAAADDPPPGPPGPPVVKPGKKDVKKKAPPVKAAPKAEAGVVVADPKHRKPWAWDAERPELLWKDRSWTHIGDNNFAATSDGADDLTRKSGGVILEIRIPLSDAAMAEVAKADWKTVVLKGSCIGNDTGKFGRTTATIVSLDGKKIGEIRKSGGIAIRVPKAQLVAARKKGQVVFRIETGGQTTGKDRDDQELGRFKLLLSSKPMPAPEKVKPPVVAPPVPPGK